VRMRNADALEPAKPVDQRNRRSIEHGDAVPQHISVRSAHQQRPLAEDKCGLRPGADHARLMLSIGIEVPCCERPQRRPGLSARRNVLPLFFAERAVLRRRVARGILGTAGGADKRFHCSLRAISPPARGKYYGACCTAEYISGWAAMSVAAPAPVRMLYWPSLPQEP